MIRHRIQVNQAMIAITAYTGTIIKKKELKSNNGSGVACKTIKVGPCSRGKDNRAAVYPSYFINIILQYQ